MDELIQITTSEQGSLVVSSLDFAQGLDIQHKNLIETIRTHQQAIEESFGLLAFETEAVKRPGERGAKHQGIVFLTEDQAMFIGTLSRNSKRVVEFKATLVKSFAQARQRLQPPVSTTEQALIQLMSQTNQLMAAQQQLLAGLRADVDELRSERAQLPPTVTPPHLQAKGQGQQLGLPGIPVPRPSAASLRQTIHRHVTDYSAYYGATVQVTYGYLYRRLFEVYSISAHRLNRQPSESLLDVLERYGQLQNLYALVTAELVYPHE